MFFEDRTEAGKLLAKKLLQKFPKLKGNKGIIVLALPRGGVPVAFEIAKALSAPLDLIFTHKLGAPGNPELAIGAVAEDGSSFIDPDAMGYILRDYIKEEIKAQLKEIKQRIQKYRDGRALPQLKDKIVILVDDGIATGNTMKAAIKLAKNARSSRVIIAVPVLPKETVRSLEGEADLVFLDTPAFFIAIGRFYTNFEQLTDEEVQSYLRVKARSGSRWFPLRAE